MRKRAQQKSKPAAEEPKHVVQQMRPKMEKKPSMVKKNWWIAISLIGIFLLVLFLNTYFNLTSEVSINPEGEGFDKFYLSGPDPYYNMRLIEGTYETGRYPYYVENDPLLNYPLGARGGRAPLFNMMAIGFSRFLTPFMNEVDAIGYSMQFIPALFGALLIFPVYFIGKELFNKKAGLIGAMFIAIIPIHLGSGHGSAYALFDHDSFNLLLFFLTFLFLIKSIKENDSTKSILYAVLAGISLAALTMTWVEAQYLYVVIAIYAIVQMVIDIFTNKIELRVFRTNSIILISAYLISLPVIASRAGISLNTPLFLCIAITAFGAVYYIFGRKKIPWTLSLPTIFSVGAIALIFLYFIKDLTASFRFLSPLQRLSEVIFGTGIYGSKVSMTIAEANTYQISHTVMSFGPSLYWLGWAGLIYLIYRYYKEKQQREYLFIITLFLLNIWLAGTAGRFLNDMVPLIAVLGGWIVWIFVDWIDYKQMLRNIRSAGGGIHGIRRGIKFLHIFGILFIAFLVVLPNAFIAFDAAVPNAFTKNRTSILKVDMFGEDHRGAFGLGVGKEKYWADALDWLNDQDTHIEDTANRPAFISWWDYGFYEVALGDHPTVADNFQDGIPAAANFHTSTSEKEAVIVMSIRLLQGDQRVNNGNLGENVINVLRNRTGENNSAKIIEWFLNPTSSPSYGDPIGEEYDENISKEYRVGQQYVRNAVYHDIVELLTDETTGLSDEEITWLYHDLQEETGFSIRYYGVEGYDKQIFNIFGFLSDKSLLLVNGIADDFIELLYEGYEVDPQSGEKIPGSEFATPAKEIIEMSPEDRRYTLVTGTKQHYKDLYFDTMFYRTYIGPPKGEPGSYSEFDWQIPCVDMEHFYAEFISDITKYPYYGTGKGAVVIAKYYEGAYINGTVTYMGDPIDAQVVVQKNLTYYEGASIAIDHDKADIDAVVENATGEFSVIAGAGNITLQIRRYPELGQNAFIYKEIFFNSTTNPDLFPISDDEAMRKSDSNYERFLNITIDPANIEGYVYIDKDDDGTYNASIDQPFSDAVVLLFEIEDPMTEEPPTIVDTVQVDETGYYNITDKLPGYYRVTAATAEGLTIHLEDFVNLYSGNNSYDIPKPKDAAIEGMVYYDDNLNDKYDSGEELIGATVNLVVKGQTTTDINTTTTDNKGRYYFGSLIPGIFIGDEREFNIYTVDVYDLPYYHSEVTISPEENKLTSLNISIELFPVGVEGFTKYNDEAVGDIHVIFAVDESVSMNTAEAGFADSEDDGSYVTLLKPGFYNVTVEEKEAGTLVYTFDDKLNLSLGEQTKSFDISMDKKSSNISGTTSYLGTNIANVSIEFEPNKNVENNTAISVKTMSEETGIYSLEVAPGFYDVTAISEPFTENDQNYTYSFTGPLTVIQGDIAIGKTFEILLTKEETE